MNPPPERLAAGVVIYRLREGEPEYLLLRNGLHKTWGFAKGHLEGDETFEQGARREVKEEAGITGLSLDPDFRAEIEYPVDVGDGSANKRVVYFLAQVDQDEVVLSDEHDRTGWETREKARSLLLHENLRGVFALADEAVQVKAVRAKSVRDQG